MSYKRKLEDKDDLLSDESGKSGGGESDLGSGPKKIHPMKTMTKDMSGKQLTKMVDMEAAVQAIKRIE